LIPERDKKRQDRKEKNKNKEMAAPRMKKMAAP